MYHQYTHEFPFLDGSIYVDSDRTGSCLLVSCILPGHGEIVIEDSTGECVTWPTEVSYLTGAAQKSVINATLKQVAVRIIGERLAECGANDSYANPTTRDNP